MKPIIEHRKFENIEAYLAFEEKSEVRHEYYFENLNRPLNTNETGSDGLVSNNGCKYFATQWNFTPTTPNSEMLFRLDVHALFGYAKSSATPDFQFPLKETDFYQNNRLLLRGHQPIEYDC